MGISNISNKEYKQIIHNNNMNKLFSNIEDIIYNANNRKDAINKICKLSYTNKYNKKEYIDRKDAAKFYKGYMTT
jgi:hypothetical protein